MAHYEPDRLAALAADFRDVSVVIRLGDQPAIEYVSDSVLSLLGHQPADFYGDPALAIHLLHRRDRDAWQQAIGGPPGEIKALTLRWTARAGHTVWADVRCATFARADGITAVYAVARDVTARVATEQALRHQQERMRLMLENATDVVLDIAPDSSFRWVSPSMERVLGWKPVELIGRSTIPFVHRDDRMATGSARDTPVAGVSRVPRFRIKTADGGYKWMSGIARQMIDPAGELLGWVAGLHDVDDQVRAELALTAQEEHFRLLAEHGSDLVFRASAQGVPEWVAPSVREILGWDPEDIVGHDPRDFIHPDDLARMVDLSNRINSGERGDAEVRLRTAAGGYRWVSLLARPIVDAGGQVVGRVGSARDIQREVDARRALARSEQRFRQAMESAPVGMAILDLDRRFLDVNPALCRMLDRDRGWLLMHRMSDVLPGSFDREDVRMRDRVLAGRAKSAAHEACLERPDGSILWVEHSIGLLMDDDGTPQSYVSQFFDITEAKRGREELHYLADHDALTRLLTRRALLESVARISTHPPRTGNRLGVLFVDLDDFKAVNDTHGHAVGDQLLRQVADRITGSARSDDLVARLGGDEIVVALPALHDADDAVLVASKIHAALSEPIVVEGVSVPTAVSIGVAIQQDGQSTDEIIRHADKALYRAKREGRDRTVCYDPAVDGI